MLTKQCLYSPFSFSFPIVHIVSAVNVAVVAGLAGYGVSRFSTGDVKRSSNTLAILDPKRLPAVKNATLEDMKKVNDILHVV